MHDLQAKLDATGIYTDGEIETLVDAWLANRGNNALAAAIDPAKKRYRDRYHAALAAKDKAEIDGLDIFRKDAGSFVRLYDFMSQIIDYGDTDLEKRSIFLRLLERQIKPENLTQPIDLSRVELQHIKQTPRQTVAIDLDTGETAELKGATAAGSGAKRDPRLVLLEEVLARLNELFAGKDFTPAEQSSWLEGLLAVLLENETLRAQAAANTKTQFVDSPDLADAVTEVVMSNQTTHANMADIFYAEPGARTVLIEMLGELIHFHARDAAA